VLLPINLRDDKEIMLEIVAGIFVGMSGYLSCLSQQWSVSAVKIDPKDQRMTQWCSWDTDSQLCHPPSAITLDAIPATRTTILSPAFIPESLANRIPKDIHQGAKLKR
jgi:hypothetical protein